MLVNCLIVSVSTDQLDYVSCWTKSFFSRDDCEKDAVPVEERALIALALEHVMLVILFIVNHTIDDKPEALQKRIKKATFLFKKVAREF